MWKWIAASIVGVLVLLGGLAAYLSDKIYLRFDHAKVSPAAFERRFEAKALKQDFLYLTATIERLHPNFPAIVDRPTYDRRKAEILAALDHPMTRQEFYRTMAPIDGEFRDGHTSLRNPAEELEAYNATGNGSPPLVVRFDDQGAQIVTSLGPPIPAGSRLRAIGDVDAVALRDHVAARISGESMPFRWSYASETFARRVWEEGLRPPFKIAWTSPSGAKGEVMSAGVSAKTWNAASGTLGGAPFSLRIDGDVAHLVVSSLDTPPGQLKAFLDTAFTTIRDRRVHTVVLDLRQNGGGDSRQGDLLQSYLSDKKLPAMAQLSVKTSPEVKAIYRTLLPAGFRWIPIQSMIPTLRGIQQSPDNGFYVSDPDARSPTPRMFGNEKVFKGELYVLISPVTYSSAVIFAAPLKYWKRATFVGQAAGEPLTFYGDNYLFDLPNTKLQASVSHKIFTLLGSRGPGSRLEPDLVVAPGDDAYQAALRDIARRRAAEGGRGQKKGS
jgi:hypothetical protein